MQFQIPQFIEVEDKIVGPLSLRQFIIMSAGVGLAALLFFMLQLWLWAILAVIIVGATVALAFVKVAGRPFWKIALSAAHFYWSPQTYVWQPEHPVAAAKGRGAAAAEMAATPVAPLREKIAGGAALHKHWEILQTGEKISAPQFTEKRMYERYQIFRKVSGEREAARRVDYR